MKLMRSIKICAQSEAADTRVGQISAAIAAESEGNGSSLLEMKFYTRTASVLTFSTLRETVSLQRLSVSAWPSSLLTSLNQSSEYRKQLCLKSENLIEFFFPVKRFGGRQKKHVSHCQDNIIFPFCKYSTNFCHKLNGTASLNGRFKVEHL